MENLISIKRRRKSGSNHDTILASTHSDRARLIYSAAFRRLQQKAQVFSLESNSSVRSRLTHSIEVSHIGRYIVAAILEKITNQKNIDKKDKDYWQENSLAISNIVETACLMHDIGNPPFGHFGEAAIIEWSKSKEIKDAIEKALPRLYSEKICNKLLADFNYFDGNPQGIRVLTRLQGEDGYYGLNLTYTQIAVFLKYTFCPENRENKKPFSKKIGYFSSEEAIMNEVWDKLEMAQNSRHPLGFLMEASDDISYCISDIEDGFEKKIISIDHFKKFAKDGLKNLKDKYPQHSKICDDFEKNLFSSDPHPISNFLLFKTNLSSFLVNSVAETFSSNYYSFTTQQRKEEIISKNSFEYDLLKILKDYTSKFLFTSFEAERMELSGFSIISGILGEYTKLLKLEKYKFSILVNKDGGGVKDNNLHIERRLFNRLPKKHINAYKTSILEIPTNDENYSEEKLKAELSKEIEEKEWHLRAHLIIDFVSGMTDDFAMETYQMLKGIKVK
ncbi:dGTPase [Pectobacterium sp. CHL-2024]|uniref:dGTPase n=1 Tax=Pectobacterium sp. CHL-2024 TaxID=3377079 RepID=UPI003807C8C9